MGDNSVRLCAADVSDGQVDEEVSNRIRASFLLAGPLLARTGKATMPPPGGDFIGRRRLDAHLDAFAELGARIDGERWIELSAPPGGLRALASFMALAAATGGELRIRETDPADLIMVRRQFRRLGFQSIVEGNDVIVPP